MPEEDSISEAQRRAVERQEEMFAQLRKYKEDLDLMRASSQSDTFTSSSSQSMQTISAQESMPVE